MKKFIWSDFVTLLLKYSKVQVCSLQETEQLRHLNPKDNIGIMVGTNMESLYDYDEAGSTDNRLVLKVSWAYLHLGPLDRELTIFPLIPVHSLIADLAIKIPTIQVGVKAGCIPPGASMSYRTISWVQIIVPILCGKSLTSMMRKSIACSAWKKCKMKKRNRKPNKLNFRRANYKWFIGWIILVTNEW